jgi:hypothetical protein
VQQAADQGRFAVIDVADDDDAHERTPRLWRGDVKAMGDSDGHGVTYSLL